MRDIRAIGWTAAVAVAWALDVTAGVCDVIPAELHGLCDAATASLTTTVMLWLIFRRQLAHLHDLLTAMRADRDRERARITQRAAVDAIAQVHGETCTFSRPPQEKLHAV